MNEQLMFADRESFRQWLAQNHDTHKGCWLVMGKGGKLQTVTPDEALEEALCYGWIDGLIKSIDTTKYIKKFSPRRHDSSWSPRNKEIVERLEKNGKMTEHGMQAVAEGKKSGAWDNAHKRPAVSNDQVEEFTSLIRSTEPAYTNFIKMSPSVQQTYTYSYLDAKQEETRKNRLKKIIERLNENKKPM
jgi:uncharacterized protein YdeI (YjbR/CyaY-like superfamily)